ncbi:unnamed protein product [Bursaphelenchus xylophilus]|uniref:Galectin n=1 Tax=Bursaphelenchus xylophilus TaxID=6326 RepID=A0A7I8X402_BURXY|nr:unnamed protein product [Bursaphelenchus xylophilus]CAG9128563.1 unnamed protein product [Bursaphelenchus xylophilus]
MLMLLKSVSPAPENISINPSGVFELALFHNALDFYKGLNRDTKVLLVTVDFRSGSCSISLPHDDSTPIDCQIEQRKMPFGIEVRFRRYKEVEFVEVSSKELGIFEVVNKTLPLVQAVEVTGDGLKVANFEIDHNARLPILRNVKFGMGDFIEFDFTTAYDFTTFYLNGRCRDTIPLQILVEPRNNVITLNAYNKTEWGEEINALHITELDTKYIMRLVNMPQGIFVYIDGENVHTFKHRTKYPYKDYVELYSDPWRGSINRITYGSGAPQKSDHQRLPRLRGRLLAPALSGSGSEPGARAGAGNFGYGSGSRAQSRSQVSQRSKK